MCLLSGICDVSFYSNVFGWLGILVAGLAIIVTILIGWNIYTVIDLKNRVKDELDKSKKQIYSDITIFKKESNDKIDYESNKNLHITFGMIGKAMLDSGNVPSAFSFLILAAWQAHNINDLDKDYDSYLILAHSCLDILSSNIDYVMDKIEKENCLSKLRILEGENITEMIEKLVNIKVRKNDH